MCQEFVVSHMSEAFPDRVPCRLCGEPVARDDKRCSGCGVKEPWIPDEPTADPRVIRLAAWAGGVALVGLLLFLSGVMIFAPAEHERDHEPAGANAEQHESR